MPKLLILCISCVLGCASPTAVPIDASKRVKLERLMELQGIYDAMNSQREAGRAQIVSSCEKQLAQMRKSYPLVSADLLDVAERGAQQIADDFANVMDPDDLVPIWIEHYGSHLTEDDIDQILAYWESPVGRKDAAATRAAAPIYAAEVQQRSSAAMDRALSEYQDLLRRTVLQNSVGSTP
jgi:hypothetical protein